jgi:hypothetical protein
MKAPSVPTTAQLGLTEVEDLDRQVHAQAAATAAFLDADPAWLPPASRTAAVRRTTTSIFMSLSRWVGTNCGVVERDSSSIPWEQWCCRRASSTSPPRARW